MNNIVISVFVSFVVFGSAFGSPEERKSFDIGRFAVECLELHNAYRFRHRSPPLVLDSALSDASQDWAEKLLKQNKLSSRPHSKYGQNLFWWSSSNPGFTLNCSVVVDTWYKQVRNYHGDGYSQDTGLFTQLVWKNSKQLGVGYASWGGLTFVVCDYYPPGNIEGQYSKNVFPDRLYNRNLHIDDKNEGDEAE